MPGIEHYRRKDADGSLPLPPAKIASLLFSTLIEGGESMILNEQRERFEKVTDFDANAFDRFRFIYLAANVVVLLTQFATKYPTVAEIIPPLRELVLHAMRERWRDSEDSADEAIEKASAAYAALAYCSLSSHWFLSRRTPAQLTEVKSLVDRALELAPDSPEAHLSLAIFHYWGHRQYEPALAELDRTLNLQPNNAKARQYRAWILRRQGKWKQFLSEAKLAEPATGAAPVYIFVTAHDAHAIRAFEVHAVDYLLKPYDKERFAKALVHARQVLEQGRKANRGLEPLLQSLGSVRPLERFVVKDKKRIFFVPVSNVLWIEATGNYACIHTAKDSHLLRETLAHLEEKLAPHHFIRVRKSAIVNGACISEIRPMFDGVYDIILAEGTVVTSSRRYAHKLRTLLES